MAEQFKKARRERSRFSLQFEVSLEESNRLAAVKERYIASKSKLQVDSNVEWLEKVLDLLEMAQPVYTSSFSSSSPTSSSFQSLPGPLTPPQRRRFSLSVSPVQSPTPSFSPVNTSSPFLEIPQRRGPLGIHTPIQEDDGNYFVCCKASFRRLLQVISEVRGKCPSCNGVLLLETTEMKRYGHVGRLSVRCEEGHELVWFSSPITNSKYIINLRMVHAFISSGLTETQYRNFMEAANLGSLEHTYLDTVMNKLGYAASVQKIFEDSLASARCEAQSSAEYIAQNGDVIITDARHDSSRSAQHTTVSAISYQSKKLIGVVNWSKKDLGCSQSREIPMTKQLINDLEAKGHKIVEVAHDTVPAIRTWLISVKQIKNSYDSWHGGKSVKKAIQKVASGLRREENKTWFSELSDKVKATKTHFHYAMRNHDGTEEGFLKYLLNIIPHYQGNHENFSSDSRCHMPDYICSKKPLQSLEAITAYRKALMSTVVYQKPQDYMTCRDTYWIETFHMVILIYANKRINFGDDTYAMRVQLAALDWNENVDREVSSLQYHQYARNPDRMAPIRVLRPKTFHFRDAIWENFCAKL